ncbi:MAG: glycoside hydrolase family 20 zincin-like fold domain-containing protein [Christensenellales bacterium]|jgi:hypothetical protein
MINLLPEPKELLSAGGLSAPFKKICLLGVEEALLDIARLRFWNYPDLLIDSEPCGEKATLQVEVIRGLDHPELQKMELFQSQGYQLKITEDKVCLRYAQKAGYINALTSLKQLIKQEDDGFVLPLCTIADYPSIPVRAVAPTFSWYAGYGRIGFDMQLWGFEEWVEFLNICLDNKINQFNMVMYGYWPFEFEEYPETVFRNVPVDIWNAENKRWLTVRYSHPNIEKPFLKDFIDLAHRMEVKIFAYVGLNSYNGAYSIKHPEARTKPPKTGGFLNDFDSLCLSYPGTVDYILRSMQRIAQLGFDGYTLEESEEGFWYCECPDCKKTWHADAQSPGEAKHQANMWLLRKIHAAAREINPDIILGIRAFRQPPLEKDPAFLQECVNSIPRDVNLFWAPGLYVPEAEFDKWCEAFGKERIWGRDSEANSITSTMGRLYRTFKSNVIRYEDETNEQVIETDIRQHIGSVERGVHGINGYVFEWYGLFMHTFAHGNYGWGSKMAPETFYQRACALNFGELGERILALIQSIITIHESQIPLYTTPFPFQKNKMGKADVPAIEAAKAKQPAQLQETEAIISELEEKPRLRVWLPHFHKIHNAVRRNAVIYDLVLTAICYEEEEDPVKKDALLDEILYLNEKDFDIVKEMFFDINPVSESGVKSSMYPYHEMKRLIHNIRNPQDPDDDIVCSGIEALGWLWL